MNYREWIRQLQPVPAFDLTWYTGTDHYSDGDVEDVVIDILAKLPPEQYESIPNIKAVWPIYYHLCDLRSNILNWYPFEKDSHVLEIGCGFGAITHVLCDRCGKVTSVELSERRAAGTLLRCRERDNLRIIVGNLNDIEFEEKFDYITLIGVLEYQGRYTDTGDPYGDFLKKMRDLLKPGGKLLIAIENQYGLKYWLGTAEDHTGKPYDGINQYRGGQNEVRTFSREVLKELIQRSGFDRTFFYYPLPDYKFPQAILSQSYLPRDLENEDVLFYYLQDQKTLTANEMELYPDLLQNHVFEFFSNSFLVECGAEETREDRVIYAKINHRRKREYRMLTTIRNDGRVIKEACYPEGRHHLAEIDDNLAKMKEAGLNVIRYERKDDRMVFPLYREDSLEQVLTDAFQRKDRTEVYRIYDEMYEEVLRSSCTVADEDNMLYELQLAFPEEGIDFGVILKECWLDMIPCNAFVDDNGNMIWFDQEWVMENAPARYVMYRVITQMCSHYAWIEEVLPMREQLSHFQIDNKMVEKFYLLEKNFAETTTE